MSGIAIAAETAQPVAGAQVSISGGPPTRTNEAGEWVVNDAATGTRVLEVRAVGFYPLRQVVNVVPGAPSIRVALETFKAVLSTVKVTAAYDKYRRLEEFKERARSGQGRYLSAEDIQKRQLTLASELFRDISGVYLDGASASDTVMMRSAMGDRCAPTFYINGSRLDAISVSDIDAMVRPSEIAGVETYMAGTVPLQYQPPMTGCGVILIWTK